MGGALLLAVAVVLYAVAARYDVRGQMERAVEFVRASGPLPFFTAMALLPAVGFPLSPFTLAAGPVFGPTMGAGVVVLCTMLGIAINVALSYWLASRALRPIAEWVVRRLGYRMPEMQSEAAWLAIVFLRVVPVAPFCVQSILLGLARVPFGPYMLISTLVPSAYAAVAIVMGDALMRGDRWAMAGAGALCVVVGVVLHVMRKRLRRSQAVES